jgi:pyruvate dehydrogenase E2 component (dihydrolipoamide acetyltransferase)
MSATEAVPVEVPDIGDFDDVPVIEILVSPGDQVAADDPLLTLESDKATMDVPAPFAGTVRELLVKVGDKVSQGTKLLEMETDDDDASTGTDASAAASEGAPDEADAPDAIASAAEAEEQDAPEADSGGTSDAESESGRGSESGRESESESEAGAEREQAPPPSEGNGGGPIYASPSVRRIARELSIDLSKVTGTGRKGRITKEDIEKFAESGPSEAPTAPAAAPSAPGIEGLPPWPSIDFEKFGPVERVDRSRIQRISAPILARNWVMIPHVTQNDEADITDLEAWRKQLNGEQSDVKVTMVAFLVKASVVTLKEFPNFNSSLDGDQLILKRYYNIGFAADTPGGLVVPVIKGADQKGLFEIASELTELSGKARAGKLGPADMQGATFTISSLGGIGGTSVTPIINAPEVAILGATRSAMKPVWDGKEFAPRLMLPLSLSYDHRVIDGAAAARFVVHLVGVLSDLRRALL